MESSTGSSSSYKVRTTLTICVEGVDFDTQACVLRLKGRNVVENKYVKVFILLNITVNLMRATFMIDGIIECFYRLDNIILWMWSKIENLLLLKRNGIQLH